MNSYAARSRVAIALLSMAILLFEILVTRLLSVTLSYHFAFLAISVSMLGLAAPAVWISARPLGDGALRAALLLGAVSYPASVLAILHFGAPLRAVPAAWVLFLLGPLLCTGAAVCILLLRAEGRGVASMYAADLAGAALGAMLAVPLLSGLPTPSVLAALGLLPLTASLLLQSGRIAPAVLAVGLAGSVAWGAPYQLRYTRFYLEEVAPLYEKWTPTARITIFPSDRVSGWGMGTLWQEQYGEALWIDQDGSAGTGILKYDGKSPPPAPLLFDVTAAQYELGASDHVCIIGGGGGKDILSARAAGAKSIEVVELNPWTVDAVSNVFGRYSGDPYHLPGVQTFVGEGRSHFSRAGRACDVLQISQIDTFAASAAGAYALTENSLYTTEAIQAFWRRLSPSGVLSISRWARGPAWPESVRLVFLLEDALGKLGIQEPKRHLAIVASGGTANVLAFRQPLDEGGIARLDAVSRTRGFERWWPPVPGAPLVEQPAIALTEGPSRFERTGYDLSPTSDDRPFFFQTLSLIHGSEAAASRGTGEREQSVTMLRDLTLSLLLATLGLLILPVVLRKQLPQKQGLLRRTVYFSAIGFAFMFVEIPLLQRLALYLGHPSYSTTVVLGALLLGAGAGSLLASRIPDRQVRRAGFVVPVLVLALTSLLVLVVVPSTQSWPLAARLLTSALLLLLLGVPLGTLLPLGLSGLEGRDRAWAWAVNGASSVLASVLALTLALLGGFTLVMQLAVGFYVLAALCAEAK